MFAKPQAEHQWLDKLVGSWNFEAECVMGPDQPVQTNSGTVEAQSLGGMWILAQSQGVCPDNGTWQSMMTLGYDAEQQAYVGTFVGSMMNHIWQYRGTMDASGRVLTLDTEGPKFDGTGMTKYQDIVEIVDDNEWMLRSKIQADDGSWSQFMNSRHRRANSDALRRAS